MIHELPDPYGEMEEEDHRFSCICHIGGRPFHYEAYEVDPADPHRAIDPEHQKYIDALVVMADAWNGDYIRVHIINNKHYIETLVPFLQ